VAARHSGAISIAGALIVWGFFNAEGATAYLRDLQAIDPHLLDGGHFMFEDQAEVVTDLIKRFYGRRGARAH
jgi:surfactin synthase thioesterase subunit